jgi:hypothetical protein
MVALEGYVGLAERISFESGILLTDVSQLQAVRVAHKLEKLDVPVALLSEDESVDLEKPILCARLEAKANAVYLYPPGKEAEVLEWKDCLLIAGAGLVKEVFQEKPMASILGIEIERVGSFDTSGRAALGEDPIEYDEIPDVQPVLEIFKVDGTRYRWSPNLIMASEDDPVKEYFRVLEDIVLKSINIPISPGAAAAVHLSIPAPVVFKDIKDLDAHMNWRLQLAKISKGNKTKRV